MHGVMCVVCVMCYVCYVCYVCCVMWPKQGNSLNKEPHELQEDDKKRHQIQAYQQLVVGRLPGGQAEICDQNF